ncbi:hypothetical protein BX666DRAFT_1926024 [Dichotomocladium elegans]|nr:hypothetical protein BX666DRAFT_1926024 [Dichotomocladium elegans]
MIDLKLPGALLGISFSLLSPSSFLFPYIISFLRYSSARDLPFSSLLPSRFNLASPQSLKIARMNAKKKLQLPSIEFMLQSIGAEEEPPRPQGHRRQVSDLYPAASSVLKGGHYPEALAVGGLPSCKQKLSVSKLAAVEPYPSNAELVCSSSASTGAILPFYHPDNEHQRPLNKATHARSYSDNTHPYLPPSLPNYLQPGTYSHHRRAISTDSLDFILQRQHQHMDHRYHSGLQNVTVTTVPAEAMLPTANGPTAAAIEKDVTTSCKSPTMFEDAESDHSESSCDKQIKRTDEGSNMNGPSRYCCPYCDKRFTRPSSLRIHTYSHTGEKPFVCTEPGCTKRFSVHSNMRRHLRVHRSGKVSKRSTSVQIPMLESMSSNIVHKQWRDETTSDLQGPYPYNSTMRVHERTAAFN